MVSPGQEIVVRLLGPRVRTTFSRFGASEEQSDKVTVLVEGTQCRDWGQQCRAKWKAQNPGRQRAHHSGWGPSGHRTGYGMGSGAVYSQEV